MYENQKEILIKYIMVQENENQIEEIIKANNKIIEDSIENMMIQVILNKNQTLFRVAPGIPIIISSLILFSRFTSLSIEQQPILQCENRYLTLIPRIRIKNEDPDTIRYW